MPHLLREFPDAMTGLVALASDDPQCRVGGLGLGQRLEEFTRPTGQRLSHQFGFGSEQSYVNHRGAG